MKWLLIRGLSREQRHWGPFPTTMAAALGDEVRCVDPPGFGTESHRRSPSTIAEITDDIRSRFLTTHDQGPWGILGISLGGMVAMDWCARHANDFERLVIVNSSARPSPVHARFRPGTLPAMVGGRIRSGDAAERATLAVSVNHPRHDLDALAAEYTQWQRERGPTSASLRGQIVAAARFRVPESIDVPALVLTSEGDRLVSADCSRAIAAHLSAPIDVHATGGHDLALDEPDWICERVRNWI